MLDNYKIVTYLAQNFEGFDNCFLRYMVENAIEYANSHFNYLVDALCFLTQIIPEVTFEELREVIKK